MNIKIGEITAEGGPQSGLYIYYSRDVFIGSYRGSGNGQKWQSDYKNRADTLIINSNRIKFGSFRAEHFPDHALWLHDKTGHVEASEFTVDREPSRVPHTIVVESGVAELGGHKYGE